MTLRYPRKPNPTLPDAWIASGRDFPEVDVKREVFRLLGPISDQKWPLSPFMIVVFLPSIPIGHWAGKITETSHCPQTPLKVPGNVTRA